LTASVLSKGNSCYTITLDGVEYNVSGKLVPKPETNHTEIVCDIGGSISKQRVRVTKEGLTLFTKDGSYEFSLPVPKFMTANLAAGGLGDAVAPMPGVIEKVMVEAGSKVEAGDPLMVMIAMKMEYVIKAPKSGVISKINNNVGDFVEKNKVLVAFEESGDD